MKAVLWEIVRGIAIIVAVTVGFLEMQSLGSNDAPRRTIFRVCESDGSNLDCGRWVRVRIRDVTFRGIDHPRAGETLGCTLEYTFTRILDIPIDHTRGGVTCHPTLGEAPTRPGSPGLAYFMSA